jgi:hypothetical protein
LNFITSGRQGIGDQRAMAAPRNRLGAHDCRRLLLGEGDQVVQGFCKRGRLHVVGEATE